MTTPNELRELVQTYRYTDTHYVVVDSLPQPYQDEFSCFLLGSACPLGDGRSRYAFVSDFERWLTALSPRQNP